jgi:hypothetical protein
MPLIQSPLASTLPWYDTGIPKGYWQEGVVPWGKILMTMNPTMIRKPIDTEYLGLIAYSPNPGAVRYTGDEFFPQFSETGYTWQCVAFAKAVSDRRSISSAVWKPGISLIDYALKPEARILEKYRGMMIAYFDGKSNYSLAAADRKHVAILLKINFDTTGKPKDIVVADQNYYSYAPYTQYAGKIAKHTIPWGTLTQKWVGYARNYHIVNI